MKPDIRLNVIYIVVFIGLIAITRQDYKLLTSVWTTTCFMQLALNFYQGLHLAVGASCFQGIAVCNDER
jgi:hypothetical protein